MYQKQQLSAIPVPYQYQEKNVNPHSAYLSGIKKSHTIPTPIRISLALKNKTD